MFICCCDILLRFLACQVDTKKKAYRRTIAEPFTAQLPSFLLIYVIQ
jgi:hypothetical protein